MPAASSTAPSPARAWKLLSSPERSVPTETFSAPVSGSYCARPAAERVKQCQPRRARASPPSLRISARASPFPEPPLYLRWQHRRDASLDLSGGWLHYSLVLEEAESGKPIASFSSPMPEEKGLLIVYTGPGKGKTTCALGTAFRAVGQGLRVLMVQFIKGSWHYGELDAAKLLGDDKFEIRPMGRGFVKIGGAETDPADIKLAQECWQAGRDAIYSGNYDLVILDEINYTISYKMLDAGEIVEALKNRPERVHVICTGRNAHPQLVELADLVTEMREVKHPYTKGILAQRGIDY